MKLALGVAPVVKLLAEWVPVSSGHRHLRRQRQHGHVRGDALTGLFLQRIANMD